MPGFDIKTAIPIADDNGVATKEPEFDINTALKITEPVSGEDGYDAFVRSQFHQQIKDSINRPLSAGEVKFIQDAEVKDPGALQSFLFPIRKESWVSLPSHLDIVRIYQGRLD